MWSKVWTWSWDDPKLSWLAQSNRWVLKIGEGFLAMIRKKVHNRIRDQRDVMWEELDPLLQALCVCVCVCLFRAVPAAYGRSQVRDWIRAVAASHSNAGLEPHLRPRLPRRTLNPHEQGQGSNRHPHGTRRIGYHRAITGTPCCCLWWWKCVMSQGM